ncbi:MAG: DUF4923 family protein [Prevotella sp.]
MRKTVIYAAAMLLMFTGCGMPMSTSSSSSSSSSGAGNVLGSIIGAATNTETITNAISSVIGLNKLSKSNLVGTWKYDGPGCAFTSQNALAKAGGEVAATQIEEKLSTEYSKLGFSKKNTYITFNEDGTFSSKIDGKSWNGNWSFDESSQQLKLSGLLLNLNGYATRNGSGISILFESKKVLTLLQTVASMSGNSTLSTVSDISKNYDGVRVGFDMAK